MLLVAGLPQQTGDPGALWGSAAALTTSEAGDGSSRLAHKERLQGTLPFLIEIESR